MNQKKTDLPVKPITNTATKTKADLPNKSSTDEAKNTLIAEEKPEDPSTGSQSEGSPSSNKLDQ